MIISNNLYEHIIRRNLLGLKAARIITGYSSGRFLRQVALDMGETNLTVFIGMSTRGMSRQDHLQYIDLMSNYSNIKIYYQVLEPCTHIKLVELDTTKGKHIYVGSANFSESGFGCQNELMAEVSDDVEDLFDRQVLVSKLVTDEFIEKFIPFYDETENRFLDSARIEENQAILPKVDEEEIGKVPPIKSINILRGMGNFYRRRLDMSQYIKFTVPIYLDSDKEDMVISGPLTFPTQFNQQNKFPIDREFKLYFGDPENPDQVNTNLCGRFSNELNLRGEELAEVIWAVEPSLFGKNKITVKELRNLGKKYLVIERINQNEYYVVTSE